MMKNILIYFPHNIAPITMANQQRVFDKISYFSKFHSVTCINIIDNIQQQKSTEHLLGNTTTLYYIRRPKLHSTHGLWLRIIWKLLNYLNLRPLDYSLANGRWVNKGIERIIVQCPKFDIVVCDYWFGATIFNYFKNSIKVIDTHNVLSQKRELEILRYGGVSSKRTWIKNYKIIEAKYLRLADCLIAISILDFSFYKKNFPNRIKVILVPIGIHLKKIEKYKLEFNEKVILFYGNLSSSQNISAFERLWENIVPLIKKQVPDLKLLIVGSNPTAKIKSLTKFDFVNLIGYVDTPLEYIKKSKVFILPLMTGGGFRGRVVEVMGIGVPSIGTHNAFDCLDVSNGINGFITDDDSEMATIAIKLMNDDKYWSMISENTKKFIKETYSFEAAYGKLDDILNYFTINRD